MYKETHIPRRGELVRIYARAGAGSNRTAGRLAVVLSPEPYNRKVGLALFCPVAVLERGYPFEVSIPPGMPASGVMLADQLESVAWPSCELEVICRLPREITEIAQQKATTLLEGEDGA